MGQGNSKQHLFSNLHQQALNPKPKTVTAAKKHRDTEKRLSETPRGGIQVSSQYCDTIVSRMSYHYHNDYRRIYC